MDIVDLREFYSSRLGQTTRRLIAARLRPKLAGTAGATIVGLGYAIPYLEDCAGGAGRRLALMMARQGVVAWPAEGEVSSALVDEFDLPLLESVADVVLVTHGLELTEGPEEMLAEIWRVLAPQGRLLLVVPNRRGLWARFDSSPFGQGQPYSRPQLARLLRDARFAISSWSQVLYLPPLHWSLLHNAAGALEALGSRAMPGLAGAIIVEATKQVYAIAPGKRVRRVGSRLKPALTPVTPRLEETSTARNALLLPGHTL
ncbi:MAG: class I SAM-dependent methyltransferase [Alphaproteobacteria bacterium]|nr:class I SAM-dependent methyltransferase [Alphaproteobacteria bacterium]